MQPKHDSPLAYGSIYERYAAYLDDILADEPSSPVFARVLNRLRSRINAFVADASAGDATDTFGYVLNDQYYKIPALPRRLFVRFNDMLTSDVLVTSIPSACDQVVELGSGWGLRLFDIWLNGGPACRYSALEGSIAGRTLSKRLASLEPRLHLEAANTDVYNFDASAIDGQSAFVFSVDVFDNLDSLPGDLFDRILSAQGVKSGLHVECLSWQARKARSEIDRRSRDYIVQHGRNENFFQLICDAHVRGLIEVTRIRYNNHGVNALMPYSVVEWKRCNGRSSADFSVFQLDAAHNESASDKSSNLVSWLEAIRRRMFD